MSAIPTSQDLEAIRAMADRYPFLFRQDDPRDARTIGEIVRLHLADVGDDIGAETYEARRYVLNLFAETHGGKRVAAGKVAPQPWMVMVSESPQPLTNILRHKNKRESLRSSQTGKAEVSKNYDTSARRQAGGRESRMLIFVRPASTSILPQSALPATGSLHRGPGHDRERAQLRLPFAGRFHAAVCTAAPETIPCHPSPGGSARYGDRVSRLVASAKPSHDRDWDPSVAVYSEW